MPLSLLASNNAQTVLSSGISSTATTLTVNTGTGSLFPSPVSGVSFFKLTLIDAATGTLTEIVHVTQRSGDTMTIVRGQEGTSSRIWSANDIAANMMTAGTLSYMLENFQPTNANLTSLANLSGLADRMPYFTAAETMALATITAAGRSLVGQTSTASMLTYLGGLKTTNNLSEILAAGSTAQASTRTNIGLGTAAVANIGTGVNQVPDMNSFPISKATNGYCALPNGLYMQWGLASLPASSSAAAVTVTFPIPFPTTMICANATVTTADPANRSIGITSPVSSTSMRLSYVSPTVTVAAYWFAIGY